MKNVEYSSNYDFTFIEKSVGLKAINQPLDVITVQNLLNNSTLTYPEKAHLNPDGKCGKGTIKQIELFQKHALKMLHPDSKIDPGGKSISLLRSRVNKSYCSGQQKPDKKLSAFFKFNWAFVAQS